MLLRENMNDPKLENIQQLFSMKLGNGYPYGFNEIGQFYK